MTEKNGSEMEVTSFDEIVVQERVVELQHRTPGGNRVRVRVTQIDMPDLVRSVEGWPAPTSTPRGERSYVDIIKNIGEWKEPSWKIAERGIVAPKFYNGTPEAGKADWNVLGWVDQNKIVSTILELSGWNSEETRELRSFRDGPGGGGAAGESAGSPGSTATEPIELTLPVSQASST